MKFGLRGEYSVYTGYFDTYGVKVILGSLIKVRLISNFRQSCTLKMAGCRAKRSDIWASGMSIQCFTVLVKLNASESGNSGSHSVYFRFSKTLCLENGRS